MLAWITLATQTYRVAEQESEYNPIESMLAPGLEEQGQPEKYARLKEGIALAGTIGRLALVPELVNSIDQHSPTRTAAMVGAVVAADVADGVIARKLGVDSNRRRIADAVTDRVTIWAAFGAAIQSDPEVLAWYAPLAVRGAVVAVGSNLSFWKRNKLVLGGHFHKLASLSQGALGVALVSGAKPSITVPTAAATYGVNLVSGMDYFGAHQKVMKEKKAPELERIRVKKFAGIRSLMSKSQCLDNLEATET